MKKVLEISKQEDGGLFLNRMDLNLQDAFNIVLLVASELSVASGISYNNILDDLKEVNPKEVDSKNTTKISLEDINNG